MFKEQPSIYGQQGVDPNTGPIKRIHFLCNPQNDSMTFPVPPIPIGAQSSLGNMFNPAWDNITQELNFTPDHVELNVTCTLPLKTLSSDQLSYCFEFNELLHRKFQFGFNDGGNDYGLIEPLFNQKCLFLTLTTIQVCQEMKALRECRKWYVQPWLVFIKKITRDIFPRKLGCYRAANLCKPVFLPGSRTGDVKPFVGLQLEKKDISVCSLLAGKGAFTEPFCALVSLKDWFATILSV